MKSYFQICDVKYTNLYTFQICDVKYTNLCTISESCDVPAHVQDLFQKASEGHDQPTREELAKLLIEFQDVFSRDKTHLGKHYIHTNNAKPVKLPPRRVPLAFEGEEKAAIEQLVQQGSIRPSTFPWASPIVMVRKRDGLRL